MVLEPCGIANLQSVLFEENVLLKFKLLQVGCCEKLNAFSGLPAHTQSLKEIRLRHILEHLYPI
jgi:hypothetical protein